MSGEGLLRSAAFRTDPRDISCAVLSWSLASARAKARMGLAIAGDPQTARLRLEAEQAAWHLQSVLIACGVNLPDLAEAVRS
jgi:hypothetical protein